MRALALAVVLVGCGGSAPVAATGDLDPALDACSRGDLDAAESFVKAARGHEAARLHARILMMRNRNKEAIDRLAPLLQGKSTDYESMERRQMVLPDLALAYVRQDNFLSASRIYAHMGETLLAKKYDALARVVAYASDLPDNEVSIDFFVTDPLPIVAGSVNGRRALFVVDTLLDEVVLDRAFARAAGVEGVARELALGRATIRNVPVHLGEAAPVGTLRPDGAIGLQFLMHFDFTLDYKRSRLVLRKAGGKAAGGQPAFLVGDRYLLTRGTMNGKDQTFVGIGSSLKGVTLAASELVGEIQEFATGPIRLVKPQLDLKSFPVGLEGQFGIPVGLVLGHVALRGRVLRLEPRSMQLFIE